MGKVIVHCGKAPTSDKQRDRQKETATTSVWRRGLEETKKDIRSKSCYGRRRREARDKGQPKKKQE